MAKNRDKKPQETISYDSITTLDEVEQEIQKHKTRLIDKDMLQSRLKEEKKSFNSVINESLKEVEEERLHEIEVIEALEQHRMVISSGALTH